VSHPRLPLTFIAASISRRFFRLRNAVDIYDNDWQLLRGAGVSSWDFRSGFVCNSSIVTFDMMPQTSFTHSRNIHIHTRLSELCIGWYQKQSSMRL
jgi:hypothetical protein